LHIIHSLPTASITMLLASPGSNSHYFLSLFPLTIYSQCVFTRTTYVLQTHSNSILIVLLPISSPRLTHIRYHSLPAFSLPVLLRSLGFCSHYLFLFYRQSAYIRTNNSPLIYSHCLLTVLLTISPTNYSKTLFPQIYTTCMLIVLLTMPYSRLTHIRYHSLPALSFPVLLRSLGFCSHYLFLFYRQSAYIRTNNLLPLSAYFFAYNIANKLLKDTLLCRFIVTMSCRLLLHCRHVASFCVCVN
jgi:hypothetical protein